MGSEAEVAVREAARLDPDLAMAWWGVGLAIGPNINEQPTPEKTAKAAEAPEVSGNVYNVGTGRTVSVLDLIGALNRIFGTDLAPVFGPSRAGDVKYSRADISRTRADLGYDPAVSFEDGLRKTVEWYLRTEGKTTLVGAT